MSDKTLTDALIQLRDAAQGFHRAIQEATGVPYPWPALELAYDAARDALAAQAAAALKPSEAVTSAIAATIAVLRGFDGQPFGRFELTQTAIDAGIRLASQAPTSPEPADQEAKADDALMLDWIDAMNARFRCQLEFGIAPAENLSVTKVICAHQGKLVKVRDAIRAAMQAPASKGVR